jgi:hypothetical protein
MEVPTELVFGVAALVYGTGLALFRLPLPQLRRWGWTLMMHSWSGIAAVTFVGSLAVIKSLIHSYLGGLPYSFPLAATFDDAIASATASRDMAYAWLQTLSYAAIALGAVQAILMLSLIPAWIGVVGIILSAIASYIFSAVFALIAFLTKLLSTVVLFMEGVVSLVGVSEYAAPAMFIIGTILLTIPFARTAGKTLMVLGAALTLILPVAIVAASPPPSYAEKSIAETADIQKLSIAGKEVAELSGGVRYTVYDRENKTLWYPLLIAEPLNTPEIDRSRLCSMLPKYGNLTCDQVIKVLEDILRTPEKAILDTGGGGYYNAYEEGYRTTLTNNTYTRRVWFLNMWITLHDKSPKKITAFKIPEQPDPQVRSCVEPNTGPVCNNIYQVWKVRWEGFWRSTKLYNETGQWMVSANRNSTFIWFTEQAWGTPKERLDVYRIDLPRVRELRWRSNETYTCELDGNSSTVETCWRWLYHTKAYYEGNKSVYFVYLNMPDEEVCYEDLNSGLSCFVRSGTPTWSYTFTPLSNTPTWSHEVMESSFTEIHSNGLIEGYGPYTLEQSIQSVDRNQPLTLTAPTEEKKILVKANQTIYRTSYDGYPETPESLSYEFRIRFTASESTPYLPKVEWDKFEEDERYTRELAAGAYVPDSIMGTTIDTMRREWDSYRNFRQGLYRDGPAHEATRRINAEMLKYRDETWAGNATILDTKIPIAGAVSALLRKYVYSNYSGNGITVSSLPLLMTEEGGSIGILKPIADLVGQAFALGLAVGFLAVVIDSLQALVGGQSIMMGYLFSKVGNISHSLRFFSGFISAVQRISKANIMGRVLARRLEEGMYRAGLEQWKHERKLWEKARLGETSRIKEWMLERLQRVEDRAGIAAATERFLLRSMTRGYVLDTVRRGVFDDEFAEKLVANYTSYLATARGLHTMKAAARAEELVRYVKQSSMAKMRPEEFAGGMRTILDRASRLEKTALVDSFARSDAGKAFFWAYAEKPAGKALKALGSRLSAAGHADIGSTLKQLGSRLEGHVRAPAAFAVAAAGQHPFTGEGVRQVPQPAYIPNPEIGLRSAGLHPVDYPVIKDQSLGGDITDVGKTYSEIKHYGSPSDIKRFEESLENFMTLHANTDTSGFSLAEWLKHDGRPPEPQEPREKGFTVSAKIAVDNRQDVTESVDYYVHDREELSGFIEWLQNIDNDVFRVEKIESVSVYSPEPVKPRDTQPDLGSTLEWYREEYTGSDKHATQVQTKDQTPEWLRPDVTHSTGVDNIDLPSWLNQNGVAGKHEREG